MKLRRNLVAWFLVFALALMNFPIMAEYISDSINALEVGQTLAVNSNDIINYYGKADFNYYTTGSALKIDPGVEFSYTIREAKELHMAPSTGKQWYIERKQDNAIGYSSGTYYQYDIYPTQMYYSVAYDLEEGSWETKDNWIEEENNLEEENSAEEHGIWKPVESIENYSGNIWYAYEGYNVILPTSAEVTRVGYKLSGWKIGEKELSPGAIYSLHSNDGPQSENEPTPTIKIQAIWKTDSIATPSISEITKNSATLSAECDIVNDLVGQGFKIAKAGTDEWVDLEANINNNQLIATASNLSANTNYEVIAYIQTDFNEIIESQPSTFTTSPSVSQGGEGSSSSSTPSTPSSSLSSSSSSGSSSPAKVEPTITLPTDGKPLVMSVNSNNIVTIPMDIVNGLVNSGQSLVIESGMISLTATSSTLKEILLANPDATNLTISLPTIEAIKLEDIKFKVNKDGKITIIGDSSVTLSIDFGNSQAQAVFSEPLTVTIDLSKVSFGDSTKLTLVKYEEKEDGSYKLVKLGGTYDKATGKFSAYITEPGLYGMAEVPELVKVNLQIGNLITSVNDSSRKNDVAPQIVDGTTVVPLRFIAESFGAEVKWDAKNKKVVITLDGQTIEVDSNQGMLIQESRTLVPIRYISESLGANVLWIPSSKSIEIVNQ